MYHVSLFNNETTSVKLGCCLYNRNPSIYSMLVHVCASIYIIDNFNLKGNNTKEVKKYFLHLHCFGHYTKSRCGYLKILYTDTIKLYDNRFRKKLRKLYWTKIEL